MATQPSAKPSKRAAQAAETKRRLIEVAIEVFSEKEYEQVAVTDIAARAEVAHGLLFHYFGNKRGIYLAAVRTTAAQLNDAFEFEQGAAPVELVRTALRQHLEYLREHRGLALRLVLGGRGADPEAWEVYEKARWNAVEAFATVAGVDADNAALRLVGRTVVAAIDEAVVQWLDDTDSFDPDHLIVWMQSLIVACMKTTSILDPSVDLTEAIAHFE
ncbi:TetR/AcrR family transcriptional regulator [Gordonia terrae]|uniref:TetR/AcrR family transcriptional regulator n=1 Tax=Gordonia terrae TaxID=2055 RepID=UPI003F6D7C68